MTQSVRKKNDPLLDSMRAQGLLMAPRWCNGTLQSAELAERLMDPTWSPLWTCTLESEVAAALVNATALAPLQVQHERKVRARPCAQSLFLP